ncbi:hypothetical protein Srubr_04720 [Streptomyces rubradiris]|uniref:Uncharacterized protein n=1 Tax=Streptomyces rubradiris TaxID=285531 RepID=A0ABQ3R442_STRRR|nr:hypothetical protein GCM10018792_23780 [Streptomyces rubradiris]GHI50626.1 hypothetical protein Srubr_04720 [Streptomyces rubradiris]
MVQHRITVQTARPEPPAPAGAPDTLDEAADDMTTDPLSGCGTTGRVAGAGGRGRRDRSPGPVAAGRDGWPGRWRVARREW